MSEVDLARYRGILSGVAERFRMADKYFPSIPFEEKKMLNIAGKILESVNYLLTKYEYHDDEVKRNILGILGSISAYIDEILSERDKR